MNNKKVITLAYARVSTKDQNLERQYTALKEYRPELKDENIYIDKQTGKTFERDGLVAMKYMISKYRETFSREDLIIEVVIKELDRIGRDYQGIMEELQWFKCQGVTVRILEIPLTLQEVDNDNQWILDMTLNIIIEVYARIAQQEVEKKHQRQMEGIVEAKKSGKKFGRPTVEVNDEQFCLVASRAVTGEITHTEAMEQLGLKRNTYYKHLNKLVKGAN